MASTSADKPLTGVKKRQQIEDTSKQVFMWVAAAAAAIVICFVVGLNLFHRIQYQLKVNGELAKTAKVMSNNVSKINGLINKIDLLKTNKQLSLPNLKTDNSTVFQVVIDALPTEDDRTAFSSSLQNKILSNSGVKIESINVDSSDTGASTSSSSTSSKSTDSASSVAFPKAQSFQFKMSFTGNFRQIQDTLSDIENTIRPILISKLTVSGSDEKLTATVEGITFYSNAVNFKVGSKKVPYGDRLPVKTNASSTSSSTSSSSGSTSQSAATQQALGGN